MCSKKIACLIALVVVAVGLLGLPGVAQADSGTWILDGSALWDDTVTTPWLDDIVADGAGNTADFNTIDITADVTVSLGAPRTIGTVIFGDTDPITTPAGWTIDNNGIPANSLTLSGITVNALGTGKGATISADVALTSGINAVSVAAGSYLTLAGNIDTAGGNTTLNKTGDGVLTMTGQYFSAGGATNNGIQINGGTLIFDNATAYPTGYWSDEPISSNGSGAGTGDRCLVMDNSTVEISGEEAYLWLQTTGGATSAMDLRGGSLTFHDPVGDTGGWYSGILMGAYANGQGNRSIITIDNDAVLNLNDHAFILTGDNQALSLGAERVVLRSGEINIPGNTAGEHGGICMGIVGGENVFDQLGGSVYYPANFGHSGTYVGALTLQWRMNRTELRSAQYNLVGGTLTVGNVLSGDGTSNFVVNNSNFNFHGGTLKIAGDESNFFKTTITGLDPATTLAAAPHAVVWSEGAVIDTDGHNVGIQVPLVAPSGSGVYGDASRTLTVTLTGTDRGEGYQATPLIRIGTESGNTAIAVANMEDDGTGNGTFRIASITITNPGTNQAVAPAVTITGGRPTTEATPPVLTTATNISGGLTKKGEGVLTLSGDNTYTGDTIIEAGTLALVGEFTNNIASSRKIDIAAGAFLEVTDLAGGSGGAIVIGPGQILKGNGTDTLASTVTGSVEMETDSVFELQFTGATTGGSIDLTGNLKLDSGWKLSLVDSGGGATPAFGSKYDLFTYGTFAGDLAGIIDFTPDGWPTPKIAQDGTAGTIYVMFGSNGDINGDGIVDATDYIILKQHFGQPTAAGENGDFDGDGVVEFDDLQTLMTALNPIGAPPTAPEPATLGLLALGALAVIRRRRS